MHSHDNSIPRISALLLGLLLSSPAAWAGTVTYYHTDAQGSPVMASDINGNIIWRKQYEPYGKEVNGVPDDVGYTGHEYDAETGLTYMQARYYDPVVGRFLSADPVTFSPNKPLQFNRYWYANGNPYLYTDPTGLEGCSDMKSQGVSGTCIDSSNFEPGNSAETVVSDAATDQSAGENMSSLKSETSENMGYFSKDSEGSVTFSKADSQTVKVDNIYTTTAEIPETSSAVGHSHPENGSSATPGPQDNKIVNSGKPNYIYQNGRIVVVEKSGGQFRVRVINGRLTNKERRSTQTQLNDYQDSENGGG